MHFKSTNQRVASLPQLHVFTEHHFKENTKNSFSVSRSQTGQQEVICSRLCMTTSFQKMLLGQTVSASVRSISFDRIQERFYAEVSQVAGQVGCIIHMQVSASRDFQRQRQTVIQEAVEVAKARPLQCCVVPENAVKLQTASVAYCTVVIRG
jgi:hypothetical protein